MNHNDTIVRHFRQILIWPLQLMPQASDGDMGRHWEWMQEAANKGSPWQARSTEFDCDPEQFQERHYREFVTFLPYVQRFLYGESETAACGAGRSPLHVFRRTDITTVRMTYRDDAVVDFKVAHIDLYFFYDIDVVILAFEIQADNLPLGRVQDTMFRFGRAFPAQWDDEKTCGAKTASNCLKRVDWVDQAGTVLATSDHDDRTSFLAHVGKHRAPKMAAQWDFLLQPMVLHHSDAHGGVRYRQIEYHRMPLMAYVAVDDPFELSDEDFFRLGMVTRPGDGDALPYSNKVFSEFESKSCYDRFWVPEQRNINASTRMLCNGHAFVVVGCHRSSYFSDPFTGALGQFRHQHFLLTLIAHFHKAALLMLSDRLAIALAQLNIKDIRSVRAFKRDIRHLLEVFLRFTQRYWFCEVSNQVLANDLFTMTRQQQGVDPLFAEVQSSVQSMNQYLESEDLRKQADTVVRLTVVTILGLVGTTVTGFLGMNLIAAADQPLGERIIMFLAALIPIVLLTFYTVIKSRPLSEFIDAMSDDRISWRGKLRFFLRIWRKRKVVR